MQNQGFESGKRFQRRFGAGEASQTFPDEQICDFSPRLFGFFPLPAFDDVSFRAFPVLKLQDWPRRERGTTKKKRGRREGGVLSDVTKETAAACATFRSPERSSATKHFD